MREFMAAAKALGDENRVRMLLLLREGELCVCQFIELLKLAPSTVSKHLAVLHQAGLVDSRKEGRWMYYRLPGRDAAPSVRRALQWVRQSLGEDPRVAKDVQRLAAVRKMSLARLCARYRC